MWTESYWASSGSVAAFTANTFKSKIQETEDSGSFKIAHLTFVEGRQKCTVFINTTHHALTL